MNGISIFKDESTTKILDKNKKTESDKRNPWLWVGGFAFLCFVAYLAYRRFTG